MTTLLMGADRAGVRLALFRTGQPSIDQYVPGPAKERHERALLEQFMADHGSAWAAIDQFVSLAVPHSHTSVRVVATILKTSAWYYGKPYAVIATDELMALDTTAVATAIETVVADQSYA